MTDEMREAVGWAFVKSGLDHTECDFYADIALQALAPYLRAMRNEVREECACRIQAENSDSDDPYEQGAVRGRISASFEIRAMKEPGTDRESGNRSGNSGDAGEKGKP